MPPFVQISKNIPKLERICDISSKISPPFKEQSCWNSSAKNCVITSTFIDNQSKKSKRAKSHDPNSDSQKWLLMCIRINGANSSIDTYSLFGAYSFPQEQPDKKNELFYFSCVFANSHQNTDYFNN